MEMATKIDDGDFLELGAMDGVGSDLLEMELEVFYSRTGGGCCGQKIEENPIRLQQRSWDAGTEATSSIEATAIEYDRWAYGTNV
jgi:hypothetical protein